MELKEIAALSGKGGLFRILKPTRNGVILEALDGTGKKLVADSNDRVSMLSEISIFTTTSDGSMPLQEVLVKINEVKGASLPVNSKSEPEELKSFMTSVLPEFDAERVYVSDIKKLVTWYDILQKQATEVFKPAANEVAIEEKEAVEEAVEVEAKAKKPSKAKAKKSEETT
jgi:hypothetical protein